jgi:hypothetical protein
MLEESLSYCFIFLSGGIVVWLSGSLSASLRGMGDMQFPASLTVVASFFSSYTFCRINPWLVWLP